MRLALTVAAVLLLVGGGFAYADPADIEVGSARSVFQKSGTRMTEQPKALSKLVKMLPYGTRIRVDEVKGRYLKVTEFQGTTAGESGWVKASQTVEPFALTQGGQFRTTGAGTGNVSRRDAAAASRQFSPTTEAAHRRVSDAQVRQAYGLLDTTIEVVKPTIDEVIQFINEGRLGRPGADEEGSGG